MLRVLTLQQPDPWETEQRLKMLEGRPVQSRGGMVVTRSMLEGFSHYLSDLLPPPCRNSIRNFLAIPGIAC